MRPTRTQSRRLPQPGGLARRVVGRRPRRGSEMTIARRHVEPHTLGSGHLTTVTIDGCRRPRATWTRERRRPHGRAAASGSATRPSAPWFQRRSASAGRGVARRQRPSWGVQASTCREPATADPPTTRRWGAHARRCARGRVSHRPPPWLATASSGRRDARTALGPSSTVPTPRRWDIGARALGAVVYRRRCRRRPRRGTVRMAHPAAPPRRRSVGQRTRRAPTGDGEAGS